MNDREFLPIYDERLKRPACLRPHPKSLPRQEYEQAARLDHPNILAIYEVRADDLITEAVAGTRLSDFLNIPGDRRAFTRQFQKMLIGPLLGALSYAHRCGVVHGFLHPGNIWLFPNGRLKVWGFGFTRLEASREDAGWGFAAPQLRRGEKPGVRSDVWSTAALLHFLFCGRLPGQTLDESVPQAVRRCLAEGYPNIDLLKNELLPETQFAMDPTEEAMLHATLANNYFRQFRVELAVLEWEKALAVCPEDRVARNNLGVAYWRWGRVEEAAECFRRADHRFNLGLLRLEQGDFPAAMDCLRATTVLQPKRWAAYLALAECLLGQNKIHQAIDELQKSLILNPESARALRNLGAAYEHLGRLQEAEQYREKALQARDQELELQPEILETNWSPGM